MTTISSVYPKRCLVDTNVLLRLVSAKDEYPSQHDAIEKLIGHGFQLYMSFQNVAEFWNVSTRPRELNGNGLSPDQVEIQLRLLRQKFEVLTEDGETFDRWLRLVVDFRVLGRQVHDARLVAHMLVRNIPWLLTSNVKDFVRYSGIEAIDPERIP